MAILRGTPDRDMMASGSKTIDEVTRLALIGEIVGKMSTAISGALVLIGDKSPLCKALAEGGPAPGRPRRASPVSGAPPRRG